MEKEYTKFLNDQGRMTDKQHLAARRIGKKVAQEYLETETDVYEFGQTVSNEDWGRGVGTSRVKKEDLE